VPGLAVIESAALDEKQEWRRSLTSLPLSRQGNGRR
jgi:hypothetical protein